VARDASGIFVVIDGSQTPALTWYSPGNVSQINVFGNGDGDGIFIESGTGTGLVYGTQDVDEVTRIEGGGGNDTAWAEDLADTVYGGDGADDLHGTDGNDLMYGGPATTPWEATPTTTPCTAATAAKT